MCMQVLNHLHKNLRNISKKSEASKKKVRTILQVALVLLYTIKASLFYALKLNMNKWTSTSPFVLKWNISVKIVYLFPFLHYPLVHARLSLDGTDGSGGGGGLLPVLVATSRGASLGGVWFIPPEPGVLPFPCGGSLSGLQQLLGQPHHLRFSLWELQASLQAGVPMPGGQWMPNTGCSRNKKKDGESSTH